MSSKYQQSMCSDYWWLRDADEGEDNHSWYNFPYCFKSLLNKWKRCPGYLKDQHPFLAIFFLTFSHFGCQTLKRRTFKTNYIHGEKSESDYSYPRKYSEKTWEDLNLHFRQILSRDNLQQFKREKKKAQILWKGDNVISRVTT